MKRIWCVAALLPLGLLLDSGRAQNPPESVLQPGKIFEKRTVISGLAGPWEMTLGPDQMLWVTERLGKRVTRVNPATGSQSVAVSIEEASAPGGQDGVMGMALHPDLLQGRNADFVYVFYTYQDKALGPDLRVKDSASPFRFLYGKVVRFRYDALRGTLIEPMQLIAGLPFGDDHNGGRLKMGPDRKLYLTTGDQGGNQFGNFCNQILSQRLPTAAEMKRKDYLGYEGKTLRLNLDGSIPADNPRLDGVVSHVWTYGHRNTQGIDFAADGTLYGAEHGPKTDDEVNVLRKGGNYGWPHIAGMKDNKEYRYAHWWEAKTPCSTLTYRDPDNEPSVQHDEESDYKAASIEPIATMFTVTKPYNFGDPACKGVNYICWPTVGVSSVEHYNVKGGVPGWDRVLLVGTLKRGSIYVLPLSADGQKAAGPFTRFFHSENRYRDTAVSRDGKTIYVATDPSGLAGSMDGGVTSDMEDKGAILAFTYVKEGTPEKPQRKREISRREAGPASVMPGAGAGTPRFTAKQVAAGKEVYDSACAVCHGSTLTNGTYGTPLAGDYFKGKWPGKSAADLFRKTKTMPPANPGSLSEEAYLNVVAFMLEHNGVKPSETPLPASMDTLSEMRIP
jgi:PQQ-dependent dehydrogenase (s-GDH family)